ncbi:glycosyltransferase family 1 protein [Agrobacterium sp. SORGH_AS 787]|uniref:glycosyltransferase family 4 protein n=1 Tax=Agrobacterium sp. SORGH_AS 787 TaxID=3041775 RepID=UPI0032B82F13
MTIFADRRWPNETGIGIVMRELEDRMPTNMKAVDLEVKGSIGSPFSPFAISRSLLGRGSKGVFFSAGFVPPLFCQLPSFVIVHDLTHRRFYGEAKRIYYDHIYKRLYRRSSGIACVSEFVRSEFLEWSGIAAEKVHLVYNGVSARFTEYGERHAPGYEYVFYSGNHRNYKNLDRLVRAYAASSLPSREIRLVLTGEHNHDLSRRAMEYGIGDKVVFTGIIPVEEMPAYYRGARAVTYMSSFEGFGLPTLEAFACGTPVITSNISSMPEVAGGAALLVDPYSVEKMAQGLDAITTNEELRHNLIAQGRKRKSDFDWDISAKLLWKLVRDCAKA